MRTAEILSKPSALKKIWATFPFICHSYEWAILKNQVQRDDVNEVKKKNNASLNHNKYGRDVKNST